MNNAFKTVGDFITGLAGLLMSLIGLAIIVEVAFGQGIGDVSVIGSITGIITEFANTGFVGLVALLVVLALVKK